MSGPATTGPPPDRSAQAWAAILDEFEGAVAGAEAELAAVRDHEPLPAPLPAPPSPPVPTADTAARALALTRRQATVIEELRAALLVLRRHLDLLDTVAEPPARPRFVDRLT